VKKAQSDLDGIDESTVEHAAIGDGDVPKVAANKHPDLGEALMQEDDASVTMGLDNDAAVQVEATQAEVQEENNSEGEEHADEKDIKRVFDLANSMKTSDLLPEGWTEKFDAGSGKNYYENANTQQTTWDPPRSLVGIALTAAQGQMQMKRELSALKMKMRMGERDLGESGTTAVHEHCPQMVSKLLGEANQLRATVKSLSAKLNLTGEQQKLLKKLMKSEVIPAIPASLLPKRVPKAKPRATRKTPTKPASDSNRNHDDLGESNEMKRYGGLDMPVELGESAALIANDDKMEEAKVDAAMKSESAKVAKRFADEQNGRAALVRKAALDAGRTIDAKMAKEDEALLESDKETDTSMQDIIGDQESMETEQALFRGTMTPAQVSQVVDPDIADMEKDDLNDSQVDFSPFNGKPAQ